MFAYEILLGLEYLHSKQIIHRDIKTLNIFLSEKQKRIKIGDFGVSKVSGMAAAQGTRVGTPLYLSPELIQHQPYDFKVDMWAVGCACYHLATLEPPFYGDNLILLGNNICHRKPKALASTFSLRFTSFVDKLLSKKPQDRPNALEAIKMIPSFIKNAYTDKFKIQDKDGSI